MSLAFVRGIHRWPVNSTHKWPVTRKMLLFDGVIMVLDPPDMRDRTADRFQRIFEGIRLNDMVYIDGSYKLKPFGIPLHGEMCEYSRKILWSRGCSLNNDPNHVTFYHVTSYFLNYLEFIRGIPCVYYINTMCVYTDRPVHSTEC